MFKLFWLRSTGFPFDELDSLALPPDITSHAASHVASDTTSDPASDITSHAASHVASDPASAGASDNAPATLTAEDERRFQEHQTRARKTLAALLARPDAAEALLLSNPDALDRLTSLGESTGRAINSRARQRLRLGWSYLQRFHTKNDTCSFFGPLAWGEVDDASPTPLRADPLDPDRGTLHHRQVFFEHWVVDRLCAALSEDGRLREVLPLTLHSGCDVLGRRVRVPLGREIRVGADAARLLRLADEGTLDARTLDAAPPSARATVTRLVSAELRLPPGTGQPMRVIADVLRATGPSDELRPVLETLGDLEAMREEFETAGRERRRELFGEMGQALTSIGVDTRRRQGEMYVGRFPVYEDCRRNLALTMGEPLARSLRERLTPVMRLFRTVAECAAARLHDRYAKVHATLPRDEDGTVDFLVFLQAVRGPEAARAHEEVAGELREILRTAWSGQAGDDTDEVTLPRDGLTRIAAALVAATPDHHRFADVLGVGIASPDVLLAARDQEALDSGDFRIVIGEVHPGVLTALQPVAMPFLDEASAKWAHAEADRLLAPGRTLLAAGDETYQRSRIDWPVVPNLWEIALPGSTSRCPPERRIPAGRGRIVERDGLLRFTDRRSGREEDVVTVLSTDLHRVLFGVAGEVLGGGLPQRIRRQGVELKRRSWTFDTAELPTPTRPAEVLAEYAAYAVWAQGHHLPRHCYFLADTEPKPIYLDWHNPLAVDTFAKTVHRAARVRLTEMSPGPDELWFRTEAGRFSSELRMSFVV
ncbi:lantibiotic dehydratase [Streptomyces sp. NPDC058653]|uniref:lantibiotic dehydratase n=1 Tax=Streptomyces sp. NPDC058653 TaxID=3346576 RepID=UPI00365CD08A